MPEFFAQISQYLTPIGIFVAAIAYTITQWRKGGTEASSEVIATYREQVQQLKEELKEQSTLHTKQINDQSALHTRQITDMTGKLGELKGLLTTKDNQITELKNLLLEKTPEMQDFYKMGNTYFKEMQAILPGLKLVLTAGNK